MGIREDVLEMKKEVKEIQEQSFAMELLKDQKRLIMLNNVGQQFR